MIFKAGVFLAIANVLHHTECKIVSSFEFILKNYARYSDLNWKMGQIDQI